MKKKFICTVCGYIHEGTEAPEKCPVCKAPASKFKEMEDPMDGPAFATVHTLGAARKEDATAEMIRRTRQTLWRAVQMLTQKLSCQTIHDCPKVVPLHYESEWQ